MTDLNTNARQFHNPPPADAILWRYMDFTKFVSLLERRALFFARADKLGDPFEGAIPISNIEGRYTSLKSRLSDKEILIHEHLRRELRRFTLISCWHESSHESEAMWKIYASANSGIAIKTNFTSFVESFITDEKIHIGKVQYIDYDSEKIPEDDLLSPYLHKRKSFEHERELRAIVQHIPPEAGPANLPNFLGDETPTWPDMCDTGIYYDVDLNLLIQEVVIDPSTPDWLLDLVKRVVKQYNLQVPVNQSHLAELPVWFPSDRIDEAPSQENE